MYVCMDKGQLNKVHSTAIYDFLLDFLLVLLIG